MALSAGINGGGGGSGVGVWVPGPDIPDFADILLGNWLLPYGPRRLERTRQPQVVRQLTINAIFLYDLGWLPNSYIMEGWVNGGRLDELNQILQQFNDDPLQSVRFLAPVLAIKDTVRLIRDNCYVDTTGAFKEPFYHLEMETSTGGYTDLIGGIAPVGSTG